MIKQIRGLLRLRLQAVTVLPTARIQLEGRAFTAPTNQTYVRETLKHIASSRRSIGPRARIREEGLYLVDAFAPAGNGTSTADDLADQIVEGFWPGLQLLGSGYTVTIQSSKPSGATQETDWRMVPVTISYRFDRINSQ